MRRPVRFATLSLLLAAAGGCTSTEPLERRVRELTWKLDAAEQAAEQATVDKRLSEREVELARGRTRVLDERLALAYDALREARARADSALHDRLTELSRATEEPGDGYEISRYGGIVLDSGVFFGSGRHELTDAGQRALDRLVAKLGEQAYADYDLELAGHTDADPIQRTASRYRDNFDLASMRANSVRRYLIERGIAEDKVYLCSWGPMRPLDAQKKDRNRRVEIVLRRRPEGEDAQPVQTAALPGQPPR